MGNILCRDKSPRRVYVKGPPKSAADYNPHLFQSDSLVNGTKKDPNNPIFYSTPNLNRSNDMKSTVSLDARIFDSGNLKRPPVAPPRKKKGTLKKGSTLPATFSNDNVRNGFKDVFGNTNVVTNNYDDIDFIDKEDNTLQERATSTPEKKLRVGNKKSDKFFGESLSDRLSDEPISPISKSTTENENDSKSQTDKKLSFFLMNMLDDIRDATDAERYKGQQPVDEPPFVAKKREIKHICDDDDHMHKHMHSHKHENDQNIAPPKPDRDFTKFKTTENENENVIEIRTISAEKLPEKESIDVQAKVIVKRGISRENLPSPPATPQRKSGVSSLPSTPTITIETIEQSNSKALEKPQNSESKKEPITENSQNITEMVDEMIKKAYGMSDFHPEDHSHDTHDELVTPTSKLAVRKISTPRKISTASTPDAEVSSVKSFELPLPKAPFKKNSFCEDETKLNEMLEESHRKFYDVDEAAQIPKSPTLRLNEQNTPVPGSTMNDIIDEIYSKNSEVMQEFQSFLEQSLEKEPVINVEEEKKFVESKKTLGDDKDELYPERDNEDGLDNCSYSDSFESSDTEPEVLTVKNSNEITNNHLKRCESIEEVDNWFSHHVEMEETESDVCNSLRNDPQRPQHGYDTQKIFPFGTTITGRRDSLSDEFFSEPSVLSRIKPNIEPLRESESSTEDGGESKQLQKVSRESSVSKDSNKSKSPDHSTLLKYLDNTIKNESNENKKQ